jgi:GDPmannose 4,6-dehydratase
MLGQQEKLNLGNLDSKRDWGYAPEYVEGMWRILQADQPDDFVLATNETHTIREFIEETFKILGEEIVWTGKGLNETGKLKSSGKEVICIDPRYFRPTEVDILIGNPAKANEKLGWKPKVTFKELVKIMVNSDFEKAKKRIE